MTGFAEFGGPNEPIEGRYSTADDLIGAFYVPLLSRALHYDRAAGYFTSWGLAAAAQGLARFLPNGGTMRLIVGAQLDPDDVAAMETNGVDDVLASRLATADVFDAELPDEIRARRRDVLTWMVAEGRTEIRVGLRVGPDGHVVPGSEDSRYFHHKYGIFDDGAARRVAFSGSGNETWSGWEGNSESFNVFASWWGDEWWAANGQPIADEFELLWSGVHVGEWVTVPLPEAIAEKLIKLAPTEMPDPIDPAEKGATTGPEPLVAGQEVTDLLERLRTAEGSGIATSGVEPLPHQTAVLRRTLDRWPRGHLFADEVGLGKTIEMGLAIREALITGDARRVLLLVPAGVIDQWQQELAEKLALWTPKWDGPGVGWRWPDRTTSDPSETDPWGATWPITLASSHLARMKRQRQMIVMGGPWDIVAVDEAHHARRRGGKPNGPPNLLLEMLHDLRREDAWRTLLLATATPMQMHPHELWDLVELFDLPGAWAEESKYERYFEVIRRDEFPVRPWPFLGQMAKAHRDDVGGDLDPTLDEQIQKEVKSGRLAIKSFGKRELPRGWGGGIPDDNRPWVDVWLLTNNPIRERLFRNTRKTLRKYRDLGLLRETIPERSVDDEFLEMTDAERAVYRRIRDYIRRHYDAAMSAGSKRKGLGFIMTVYRRRLTSSFPAIRASLARRLDVLEGRRDARDIITEDDLNLFDERPDLDASDIRQTLLDGEIAELRDFIGTIDALDPPETKLACLSQLIADAFAGGHRTVLIFSQYADTVDHLGEQLNGRWPGQVLAYTSGGGRLWDAETREWDFIAKAEAKNLFLAGDEVKILVGTDTLSEGLNLQTCARLVNYDMPWNFTRVEQRIGRIDRIGGHEQVHVTNLFYSRTVEATIYRSLVEGFGGFDFIVGDAQPVLGDIAEAIEKAVFSDDEDHAAPDSSELFPVSTSLVADIRAKIAEAQAQAVRLSDLDDEAAAGAASRGFPDGVTLEELAATLLADPAVATQLKPHPIIEGAWEMQDEVGFTQAVTLDRGVLAENSPDVRLLAPGDPLFDLVLSRAGCTHD